MFNQNFYGGGMNFFLYPDGHNFFDKLVDGTSLANRPTPNQASFLAWNIARIKYLKSLVNTNQTPYYFDSVNGNDANDGRDGIKKASATSFVWNEAAKTLTKLAAFTSYVFGGPGVDQIYVSGGTNVVPDYYTIISRNSNNDITLDRSITSDGSSPSDVTVSTGPKQTVTAMNTLIAAGNCRLLLHRGQEWVGSTRLLINRTPADYSFDAYHVGSTPSITTRDTLQACGASWTAAAPAYYITRSAASPVGGVRERGNKIRFYVRCSTIAECQATPGSFFHDTGANRLYVQAWNSNNLTTVADTLILEIFPVTDLDGFFINTGANGNNEKVYAKNLEIVGFGAKDTVAQTSCYSYHSEAGGESIILFENCTGMLANNHIFGSTAAARSQGGKMICINCAGGWCTYSGHPFVAYAGQGGQEMYLFNCIGLAGDLLRVTAGVTNYSSGCSNSPLSYVHTSGGSYEPAYAATIGCVVKRGQMAVQGFGSAANVTLVTDDIKNFKVFNINCYFEGSPKADKDCPYKQNGAYTIGNSPYQIVGGTLAAGFSVMNINCMIDAIPKWANTSTNFMYCIDALHGYYVNTIFRGDLSYIALGTKGAAGSGLVNYGQNFNGHYHFCHFHVDGGEVSKLGLCSTNAKNNAASANDDPTSLYIYDSIITMHADVSGDAYLACGNNRDWNTGLAYDPIRLRNIFTNVPYSTDTYRGNDQVYNLQWLSGWAPGKVPFAGEVDVVPNELLGGYRLEYDFNWRPRRNGLTAAGPFEVI